MTRLYHSHLRCDICHNRPAWGWLYLCTQDHDLSIADGFEKGDTHAFDTIGEMLLKEVKPAKGGPEARQDKHSLLKEMTSDEMVTYTPQQLATLLEQREDVLKTARKDKAKMATSSVSMPPGLAISSPGLPGDTKPWILPDDRACNFKICHRCRTSYGERAYLSLNGISNGDITATAAAGFGFHMSCERPVADANIVKHLGERAVPLKKQPCPPSSPSVWSIASAVDEQLELSQDDSDHDTDEGEGIQTGQPGGLSPPPRRRLAAESAPPARAHPEILVRPPWTPPPTPTCWAKGYPPRYDDDGQTCVDFLFCPNVCDGRSPSSLKTNPAIRRIVFESLIPAENPHTPAAEDHQQRHIPYEPEEAHDVGLFLPFNQQVHDEARSLPLPPPTVDELLFFAEVKTCMEEAEDEEGVFSPAPLDVPEGVAVTEEGVGYGAADILTQA